MLNCPELANVTANSATGNAGPAAVAANSNYDLFVWNNAGSCTLTHGPVWSSNTTRATTLTASVGGTNYGILTNNSAIANGPGANQGTYVGTVHSNGSSTIDYIFGGSASGGTACSFQVWNEYNRVLTACIVTDSGASYTYTSATIRQARASAGNQGSLVIGQQEDSVQASEAMGAGLVALNGAYVVWGIGLDTTTAFTCRTAFLDNNQSTNTFFAASPSNCLLLPGIGNHVISANEGGDGSNAKYFGHRR